MSRRIVQTADIKNRIYRAMNQKIFLLKANFKDDNWTFYVQGTSFNVYEIFFSKTKVKCSCPDCQTRNYTCKHIIFIIGKVAKNENVLESITINLNSVKLTDDLTQELKKRLNKRLEKKETDNTVEIIAEDCIICFDPITTINKSEQECKVCKIVYHVNCINRWLNTTMSCCHCKQPWENDKNLDELNKFVEFKQIN